MPYLDVFQITAQKFTKDGRVETKSFEINPDRLTKQVIYFTVTAQIVNFLLEIVVPYAKRKVFKAVQGVQEELKSKNGSGSTVKDDPDEASFLARVRNEAELDVYDVTIDYREMVVQFGNTIHLPPPESRVSWFKTLIISGHRLSVLVLGHLATDSLLVPREQLDRSEVGRDEDCHRKPATDSVAR